MPTASIDLTSLNPTTTTELAPYIASGIAATEDSFDETALASNWELQVETGLTKATAPFDDSSLGDYSLALLTRGQFLEVAAIHPLNAVNIDLAGLQQNGVEFV